uniref:G-protein coupled receptors family 3 profile domain-containing protein n=1 Tax=Setaria digitata TaxID=48799 RepID=A0A915PYV6_9BILA
MTSLCMCISMSGTVALCCFFAPKVYIAICQPYKNVRMRQSAVGHLVNQQMRASAETNSVVSSQINQQYGAFSQVTNEKSPAVCSANSNNSNITDKCNNRDNSLVTEMTPFLLKSSDEILHSDDELSKETAMYQNNVELFLEQLFVNYDVTFV